MQFVELEQVSKCFTTAVTKESYDAINFCIHPVQLARATRSAFAYERPAFAYMIIFTFDRF